MSHKCDIALAYYAITLCSAQELTGKGSTSAKSLGISGLFTGTHHLAYVLSSTNHKILVFLHIPKIYLD